MAGRPKTRSPSSPLQKRLSLFLLAILVIISGSILWIQGRYDPSAWREQPGNRSISAPPHGVDGLVSLSPSEQFHAGNLSDKINGKADLYLAAGFKSLESQRFSMVPDQAQWMERMVYDMGGHPNAYAVFSAQRRKDIQSIDTTPHAYISANGLFMVHGPFYVEIIASDTSDAMQISMKALASAFVTAHPVAAAHLPELALFGSKNQVPQTTRLVADSAFGIEGLNWVFTCRYASEQEEATAFIVRRSTPAEAQSTAEMFIAFWREYEGEAVPAPDGSGEARIVMILDNYEIVRVQGRYVFGVHESTDLEFGLALLAQLQGAIER